MYIHDEWGTLKKVMLGSSQKYMNYTKSDTQHKIEQTLLKNIKTILEKRNIKVIEPNYIKDLEIEESLWVRDSSIVIDDQAFLLPLQNNHEAQRLLEYKTIPFKKYTLPPKGIQLEGGDILQMKTILFIGIHERTNVLGYRWIKQLFPNKHILKIHHKALHLDCCFSILPNNIILYSKKYIHELPTFVSNHFQCINVDTFIKGETNLSTNFLFLDKTTILIDNRFKPIHTLLKSYGFHLILVNIANMWKYGGSIRCLTQPLIRNKN